MHRTTSHSRQGFTLIEIVIAVAIVAIMAGTIAPFAFREIARTREDATGRELAVLHNGLLDFYEDTGRFPSEAEGLLALVTDPGVTGWAGPYVGGGAGQTDVAVTTDDWGLNYAYDLSPVTSPVNAAQVLVASAGSDRVLTMGSVGNTWNLNTTGDDLHTLVVAGPRQRAKTQAAIVEMETIGDAGRRYFSDYAIFPNGTGAITGSYMDPGLNGGAFVDPWQKAYQFTVDNGSPQPPTWVIRSFGPNQVDENGGGDDLTLNINSAPPARRTTLTRLSVAQLVLNQDPNLNLSGNWAATDRGALNLSNVLDNDGWGREYQLNVNSRLIFSMGPDGNAATTTDNIPVGAGP